MLIRGTQEPRVQGSEMHELYFQGHARDLDRGMSRTHVQGGRRKGHSDRNRESELYEVATIANLGSSCPSTPNIPS
jgi:hypothetical protein